MNNLLASAMAQTEMSSNDFTGQASSAVGVEVGPNGELLGANAMASTDLAGQSGMMSADAMAMYKKL
ncbi:MAG TPA: hypothetical protein PKZ97_03800 [Azospirillaceae bacterium]|nr:hypothetical protein [Azospirillaceae bacterium]HRQ80219.1 hypothetical protein [Azospirillaceae bacterium]